MINAKGRALVALLRRQPGRLVGRFGFRHSNVA
jgi:hypothetical protein